jgi:hypothetical protein
MRRIMARRTYASAGVLGGGGNQPELVPKARAQAEDVTHLVQNAIFAESGKPVRAP